MEGHKLSLNIASKALKIFQALFAVVYFSSFY